MKKQWWHDKIAYQIYPKSFMDSNGDGVGDLNGIIQKLDYLEALGVDIIWLSPIYKTPFVDQGYDISDYYQIDELFGSMEDMERLLAEAEKRNIAILMDLVVNHCSSEHEWFKKAVEDPDGKYGKYFIIKESDKEPNNWRSYFGGSVWEPLPNHSKKYYLHMFAKEQPDLNWENPELVNEVYRNINWWLEKGLKGFRIDAIVNIKKDLKFRDVEPDGPDGRGEGWKMLAKAKGLIPTLQALKEETFAKYNAFTVAELFNYSRENLADYIGDEGCFSTIFDFSTHLIGKSAKGWYDNKPITAKNYRQAIFETTKMVEGKGLLCSIIENHDEPRGVSHYLAEDSELDDAKKVLATIFMMRKGLPFLYQGQEIGMTNCKWNSIDEINDIATIDQYNVALQAGYSQKEALNLVSKYSRDNARTPMQWSADKNAGFSTANPWLRVNPNYQKINVETQDKDQDSVLNYYKQLIKLRKSEKYKNVIVYGQMIPAYTENDDLFGFYRKDEQYKLLVLGNMGREDILIYLEEEIEKVLVNNQASFYKTDKRVTIRGFQALVLQIK